MKINRYYGMLILTAFGLYAGNGKDVKDSKYRAATEVKERKAQAAQEVKEIKALAAVQDATKRNLDIIILIDIQDEADKGALNFDFAAALQQKAVPIITSENILFTYLKETERIQKNEDLQRFAQHAPEVRSALQKADFLRNIERDLWAITTFDSPNFNRLLPEITDNLKKLTTLQTFFNTLGIDLKVIQQLQKMLEAPLKYLQDHPQPPKPIINLDDPNFDRTKAEQQLDEHFKKTYSWEEQHNPTLAKLTTPMKPAMEQLLNVIKALNQQISEAEFLKKPANAAYIVPHHFDDWIIYKHTQEPIYLFIPQSYRKRIIKEFETAQQQLKSESEVKESKNEETQKQTYSDAERALGLTIDHTDILEPIEATSHAQLLALLSKKAESTPFTILNIFSDIPDYPLEALEQLFVVGKSSDLGNFNIYLSGHGRFAESSAALTHRLKLFEQTDAKFKTLLETIVKASSTSTQEQKISSASEKELITKYSELFKYFLEFIQFKSILTPTFDDAITFLAALSTPKPSRELRSILYRLQYSPLATHEKWETNPHNLAVLAQTLLKELQTFTQQETKSTEAQSSERDPDSAVIAGLTFTQFKKFLRIPIKIRFLYVTTCFGGGWNAELVRTYLQKLESEQKQIMAEPTEFIIAFGSVDDSSVLTGQAWLPNFTKFFGDLHIYFARSQTFKEDPLRQILAHVTPREPTSPYERRVGFSAIPSIYIPQAGGPLQAVQVNPDILVLTHALLKAHELTTPPTPINTKNKSALLINPATISVPIILGVDAQGYGTALIPKDPNQPVYSFAKIEAPQLPLSQFLLYSIIKTTESVTPRTYIIQTLLCKNYLDSGLPGKPSDILELHDVWLQSTLRQEKESEYMHWSLLCTLFDTTQQAHTYTTSVSLTGKRGHSLGTWKEIDEKEAAALRKAG